MIITVKDRQTMPDIALIATGSFEGVMELSIKNDIGITEGLSEGIELTTTPQIDDDVVERYSLEKISPATEIVSEYGGGIGYMAVEINFRVY